MSARRSASAWLRCLLDEEAGQDLVEYALLAAFIGLAGAAVWVGIRAGLGNAYSGFDSGIQDLWEPENPGG